MVNKRYRVNNKNIRNTNVLRSQHGGVNYTVLVAALTFIAYITVRVLTSGNVATVGEEIKDLEQQRVSLQKDINLLQTDIAKLSSIATIEKKAREDLGMVNVDSSMKFVDASDLSRQLAQN